MTTDDLINELQIQARVNEKILKALKDILAALEQHETRLNSVEAKVNQ